jgi:hypothetical protein
MHGEKKSHWIKSFTRSIAFSSSGLGKFIHLIPSPDCPFLYL